MLKVKMKLKSLEIVFFYVASLFASNAAVSQTTPSSCLILIDNCELDSPSIVEQKLTNSGSFDLCQSIISNKKFSNSLSCWAYLKRKSLEFTECRIGFVFRCENTSKKDPLYKTYPYRLTDYPYIKNLGCELAVNETVSYYKTQKGCNIDLRIENLKTN